MHTRRERVESLGIGAAQEFLLAGRDAFRALSNLLADGPTGTDPVERAVRRIRKTIRQFRDTVETVRADLPLPEERLRAIEALPWEQVTERGIEEGYVAGPDDRIWRTIVSAIRRGDPLASVELLLTQLSNVKRHLESLLDSLDGGPGASPWPTAYRAITAYLRAVRIGVSASYANAVVGRRLGAETVPGSTG